MIVYADEGLAYGRAIRGRVRAPTGAASVRVEIPGQSSRRFAPQGEIQCRKEREPGQGRALDRVIDSVRLFDQRCGCYCISVEM